MSLSWLKKPDWCIIPGSAFCYLGTVLPFLFPCFNAHLYLTGITKIPPNWQTPPNTVHKLGQQLAVKLEVFIQQCQIESAVFYCLTKLLFYKKERFPSLPGVVFVFISPYKVMLPLCCNTADVTICVLCSWFLKWSFFYHLWMYLCVFYIFVLISYPVVVSFFVSGDMIVGAGGYNTYCSISKWIYTVKDSTHPFSTWDVWKHSGVNSVCQLLSAFTESFTYYSSYFLKKGSVLKNDHH